MTVCGQIMTNSDSQELTEFEAVLNKRIIFRKKANIQTRMSLVVCRFVQVLKARQAAPPHFMLAHWPVSGPRFRCFCMSWWCYVLGRSTIASRGPKTRDWPTISKIKFWCHAPTNHQWFAQNLSGYFVCGQHNFESKTRRFASERP